MKMGGTETASGQGDWHLHRSLKERKKFVVWGSVLVCSGCYNKIP